MREETGYGTESIAVELAERLRREMGSRQSEAALEQMERVLRSVLEQIDLCGEIFSRSSQRLLEENPVHSLPCLPGSAQVACQGVPGAFSQVACESLFPQPHIRFFGEFEEVFAAVENGQVDFGILPVENSSGGQVTQVLELVSRHRFSIAASCTIAPRYCLCVHPQTDPEEVTAVISHPQGLLQCKGYLQKRGYRPEAYSNTAAAAKKVGEGGTALACVCSRRSAELYGLRILDEDVQDYSENYTRFICISRDNIVLKGADTVSIALEFPNEPGYLNRLLTRFAVCNLDLCKIMSMPIASRDFNVRFYLDFTGSIADPQVVSLLSHMYGEFQGFRFLGNYVSDYDQKHPRGQGGSPA